MKIRNGFISNSSSCSFIVHDAKSAMKAFKKEFGKKYDYRNVPYGIEDIDFFLRGDRKILEKVKDFFGFGEVSSAYEGNDMYELHGLSLEALMRIPSKNLSNVKSIGVSADDLVTGNVVFVRLLREFFEREGLYTENCGDKWSTLDNDDLISRMIYKLMHIEHNGDKNED